MKKVDLSNVSEVQLTYSTNVKAADRFYIGCSQDAEKILREFWEDTIEHTESMKLILLNRANKVLGITTLSNGGTTGTVCDNKVIFQYALKANASGIILAHNHPSGNLKPSEQDKRVTHHLKEAGKFFNIPLLDHLIISAHDGYYSFADEGLI